MKPLVALAGGVSILMMAAVVIAPAAEAEQRFDVLRLTSGEEILIRPGWDASYEKGSFWFEYLRPRRLACTLPLQDVAEIVTADGTVYRNTYEAPQITFTNQAILDVFGTIIQHGPLYPWPSRESQNRRGWNSRTGRYEAP